MDDFYFSFNGTNVEGQAHSQSTEDSTILKQQPKVPKPLKVIIPEAEVEHKREEEQEEQEKRRRKKRRRRRRLTTCEKPHRSQGTGK